MTGPDPQPRPGSRILGGVVLAAGAGHRLGRPKALVELDDQLLVDRAVDLAAARCEPVVVVVGASAGTVAASITPRSDVQVVINDDWEEGMSTSVAAGLRALEGRADGALVLLVDQPGVTDAALARLEDAWRAGAEAVTATFDGQQRPPVILDARVWSAVTSELSGDAGARRWLRRNPDRVVPVPCDDVADPADIDTPDDLAVVRRR